MSNIIIREDTPKDYRAITRLTDLAFGGTDESRAIDTLRLDGDTLWSKVLLKDRDIIGHIQFYNVWLDGKPIAAGLGPISVHPDHQRSGYGGQLIRAGLAEADPEEKQIVFLLGHISYYPRFGFSSELAAQYISPWSRPAFMALKLNEAAPTSGQLTFPKAFT